MGLGTWLKSRKKYHYILSKDLSSSFPWLQLWFSANTTFLHNYTDIYEVCSNDIWPDLFPTKVMPSWQTLQLLYRCEKFHTGHKSFVFFFMLWVQKCSVNLLDFHFQSKRNLLEIIQDVLNWQTMALNLWN